MLLPGSVAAVLCAGLALLAGAALSGSERIARGSLASHAACVLAMPVAVYGCALAAVGAATLPAQAATMVLVDLGVVALLMPVLLGLLRRRQTS